MATNVTERTSARERLLAAANQLFYAEGVHTVGIDRIIEHAGVAKATLYSAFGSKDELIRAYLRTRHDVRRAIMDKRLAAYGNPRDRLLGVFDVLGDTFLEPGFHGCAFVNASAEANPDSPILEVTGEYRAWVRALFVELARDAGAAEPEQLAGQLQVLYDGAGIAARMDKATGA
ncbi:MAG TPA: TetR/AcrR family transcriptional regulator, partial [Pseudonocardiaceae bacterium]|nr:TetR/AcrR family transcriptional regulator [Pseudonocardiaceae bacterium]